MEANSRPQAIKGGRSMDGAYGFSFSIALGLILFIAGLVISLTLSGENSYGLIFGVPLLIAGLLVPLFMMRNVFSSHDVEATCPACGTEVKTSEATVRLDCPGCGKTLAVRDDGLHLTDSPS